MVWIRSVEGYVNTFRLSIGNGVTDVLGLNVQLQKVIQLQAFKKHIIDIIDYRVINYFRKRYREEEDK